MNKKAIAILGAIFLLIVGTLGFLVYTKYVKKADTTQNPPSGDNNASTTNPSVNPTPTPTPSTNNSSNIIKLTDDQVLSPTLFYSGSGVAYFDHQGNLFKANLQDQNGTLMLSNKERLGAPPRANISKILWPSKGDDFIAQFEDPNGKLSWSYFNSTTTTYSDLPPQVESVDWMPNGSQIMYVWLENNKASLNLGDPDTKNYKTLGDMWETDDAIQVSPYGDQVLYYQTNNPSSNNSINLVSSDGKVWKGLEKTGQNFGVLWSPDNQKFLFAKKDPSNQKYQLWIYNLTSSEVKNLGLFTTVEKAVWDKDSRVVYAAVPVSGTAGENSLTVDSFFSVDISTLERKEYNPRGNMPMDGRDLFLNFLTDKLFFRNAQDGALYYLDLTK